MAWPDNWTTEDGLVLNRVDVGWKVDVVRELPARLGEPCSVELPRKGAQVKEGATLMAIELSKARVEFAAPAELIVCEAHVLADKITTGATQETAWLLVIRPVST